VSATPVYRVSYAQPDGFLRIAAATSGGAKWMRKLRTATALKREREREREIVFESLWGVKVRDKRPMVVLRTSVNALSSAFDQFEVDSLKLGRLWLGSRPSSIKFRGFSLRAGDLNLE